jgi:hypothetical protein
MRSSNLGTIPSSSLPPLTFHCLRDTITEVNTNSYQMNEKAELERAACEWFLQSYNAQHDTAFAIKEHRDRPDFIATDPSGQEIGVEATHLHYDFKAAKMVLSRAEREQLHGIMQTEELIARLNTLLESKAAQAAKYNFENRLFLVIRSGSPIHEKADFEMFEEDIHIPASHPFAGIWLLCRNPETNQWTDLLSLSDGL